MLEKAIKLLKQYQGYEPMSPDEETLKHSFDLTDETVDTLLSALRPVSREQLEKVWRGEWKESGNCDHKPYRMKNPEKWRKFSCAECGYSSGRSTKDFCPSCGTAKTDKAVDIIMQRLEALNDGESD